VHSTKSCPTAKHGDVDKNGDLVNRLRSTMPDESPIDLDQHAARIAAVVARKPDLTEHLLEQTRR